MRIRLSELRSIIRSALREGGLKVPTDKRRDLSPALARDAVKAYESFVRGWNEWLESRGIEPVQLIRPSGSTTHAEQDAIDRPDAVYGDIDYLVSIPVAGSTDDMATRRRLEAVAAKAYAGHMVGYLHAKRPHDVDVELSVQGDPLSVIMRLQDGSLVQVDTVVTHPSYSEWMKGRYTPERGIKGYVTGNLYKALGDFLVLTIGTEGVIARTRGAERVPAKFRSGITYKSISTDFKTFLADIATYLLGPDHSVDPLLRAHPGLDPDNVTVTELAQGIVGLANTLDTAKAYDRDAMLTEILAAFEAGMTENVDKKASREITPEKEAKLRRLNDQQLERVRMIFGV